MPAERELIVSNPTYAVPILIELKLPAKALIVLVNVFPIVKELATIDPVLRDIIFAIPIVPVPALIELNAPPAVVKEPIDPLLMDAANNEPTVKLLNVPVPALRLVIFAISIVAVPALIELNAPAAVRREPIDPLLIDVAKSVPIVNVLAYPTAVLKELVL